MGFFINNLREDVKGGLVGYWKFDEGTGASAIDYSTYRNHGSLIGSPIRTNGILGGALRFNGTSMRVDVANTSSLNITSPSITVCGWMYRLIATRYNVIFTRRSGGNLQYQLTWVRSNEGTHGNKIRIDLGMSGGIVSFNSTLAYAQVNQWVFLAATYDGANVRIYFNGNNAVTTPETRNIDTKAVTEFIGYDGAGNYSECIIDDVRVYNRAITEQEIKVLYRNGASKLRLI